MSQRLTLVAEADLAVGLGENFTTEFAEAQYPAIEPALFLILRVVHAHLDWATTDRDAEVARHVAAGSTVVAEHELWTVMRGPGTSYCVTDRDPTTGMLT